RFYHAARPHLAPETAEFPGFDGFAEALHELQVVMEVVDRMEARAEDLARAIEVVQVGAGEVAAGVARAIRVEGRGVLAMPGIADLHVAAAREKPAVAGVA